MWQQRPSPLTPHPPLLPRLMLHKSLLSPEVAVAVEISGVVEVVEDSAAEPTEADKIIIVQINNNNSAKTKTKTKVDMSKNLTNGVPVMLMGPQIARAAVIGPKDEGRPTAPIPSSAAGPPSSPPGLKTIIEKLAS